jgi:hypothetical protein
METKTGRQEWRGHHKKMLIKEFHVLLAHNGGNAAKEGILAGFGVEHTTELNIGQLQNAIAGLEKSLPAAPVKNQDLNLWRKRLMASAGSWLALSGGTQTAANIKAVACRAAQKTDFNKIPLEQLRNLYYGFLKKQKDFRNVDREATERLLTAKIYN